LRHPSLQMQGEERCNGLLFFVLSRLVTLKVLPRSLPVPQGAVERLPVISGRNVGSASASLSLLRHPNLQMQGEERCNGLLFFVLSRLVTLKVLPRSLPVPHGEVEGLPVISG